MAKKNPTETLLQSGRVNFQTIQFFTWLRMLHICTSHFRAPREWDIGFQQPLFPLCFWGCLALEFLLCKLLLGNSILHLVSVQLLGAWFCCHLPLQWVGGTERPTWSWAGRNHWRAVHASSELHSCTGFISVEVTFTSQGIFCLRNTYMSWYKLLDNLFFKKIYFFIVMPPPFFNSLLENCQWNILWFISVVAENKFGLCGWNLVANKYTGIG